MAMTFDEWKEKYNPIMAENWDTEPETWTYEYAITQNPLCVWTIFWAENFEMIVSGFRITNSVGYIITENPFNAGEEILVEVQEYKSLCQNCEAEILDHDTEWWNNGLCENCYKEQGENNG